MQPHAPRRINNNNNMTDMEDGRKELKKQAQSKRELEAKKQAFCKYPEDLKEAEFNLQPQQQIEVDVQLLLRKCLGDYNMFRKVLRQGKSSEQLLLGLDSTAPGTPEVNDFDFEGPFNGLLDFVKPGKNGTNHVYKKSKQNEFAEPKGRVEGKGSAGKNKHPPKALDTQKQNPKETTKIPNNMDIGDIIKKMTHPLPDTLTDIETPGKVPTSKTFEFPRAAASQVSRLNKTLEKMDGNEGCKEGHSTIKEEPRGDDEKTARKASTKKVGARNKKAPNVKATTGEKKKGRKVSTSSTTSDDECAEVATKTSEQSSDSESEKKGQVTRSKKNTRSAIGSPTAEASPSSAMHKTEYGFSNNIFNKENTPGKLRPAHPYFPSDASIKSVPINELNDFPYVQPNKNSETDDPSLLANHPSLSPMETYIETISPLDPNSLFDGLEFTNFGNEELMAPIQSKSDDLVKGPTSKSRLKPSNSNEEFKEPSLDDSLDDSPSNRLTLPNKPRKAGALYQKDKVKPESKTNSKLCKSNDTKTVTKSKNTRVEATPPTPIPTKAARKYIPPDGRRKSVSDSSDKEDTSTSMAAKTRGSKDNASKKMAAEKSAVNTSNNKKEKTPKRDRLKPKVSNASKSTINVDKSGGEDSSDDVKPVPDISSPILPNDSLPCTSATTTELMPTLLKTSSCSMQMHDPIPNLTDTCPTIPNDFIPPFSSVDDRFGLDDAHFGTTLSPMNSPEHLVPKCTEPPQLVKEIKDEEMAPPYDISASPVRDYVPLPNNDSELVNRSLNSNIIDSQGSSLVSDMFTSQSRIDHITSYDIFPPSLSQPSLLLSEISSESILLDPTEIKPDVSEQVGLWINDDPYSVNDIENIVPTASPPLQPLPPTSSAAEDHLDSLKTTTTTTTTVLTENCVDATDSICNDIDVPSKLTIRIPLQGIKLKTNNSTCRNRTSSACMNSSLIDSSLSPNSADSFEIDVVNDRSPLKRKRKKLLSGSESDNCNGDITNNNTIRDVSAKLDVELEDFEKLIIRISLAKLRRTPFKGKERPPKISKPDPELNNSDASSNLDQSTLSYGKSPDFSSNLLGSCSPVQFNNKMKDTDDSHQNDLSHTTTPLTTNDKDMCKKLRGRAPKPDKLSKPDLKQKLGKEDDLLESCDSMEDVCHECGTLRKDYGRDPVRMNYYRKSYSPYFTEAREFKHQADNLKTPIERAHKYTQAVLKYVQYLIGMEVNGITSSLKGVDEFSMIITDCTHIVDYVITNYGRKENSSKTKYDPRFLLLCLRLQSILYLKLFKVKKDSAMKYSKVLSRYFKNYKAGHTGPTPYPKPVHSRGSTGTPSPSSPSPGPSPGGSVASIGSAGSSAGSTGGNDITANGHPNGCVTIPFDVHEKAYQHLQYSKNLLHGHQLWDESDLLMNFCNAFVTKLCSRAGQLTMQSSFLHVVDYVSAGLELIKESPLS